MSGRLTKLGIVLTVFGLLFFIGAGYAWIKVQDGTRALTAFSAAQNVQLTYNEQGQLTDHGTTDGAAAIMSLLNNEWGYATNPSDFDPNDPIVNTPSEYMYQMAAISEHTLSSTVTLPADIKDANGNVVAHAGDKVAVDGRYYADFNFANPVDSTVRGLAWSPLPLALIGQLGVGAVTASSLQAGIGLAGLFAAVGFMFIFAGLGLVWAARPEKETVPVLRPAAQPA
jgi:YD repeat-containing protein